MAEIAEIERGNDTRTSSTAASVADGDGGRYFDVVHPIMATSIHQLDDGAWISVNDSREVPVSDLWLLARHDFCPCEVADFLAEGFVEVSVDHPNIEARIAGRCIGCGTEGVTDWLAVGRVIDPESGEFYPVEYGSLHVPEKRTRLAIPP